MIKNIALLFISTTLSFSFLLFGFEVYLYLSQQKSITWHDPLTEFDSTLGWIPIPSAHGEDWGGVTNNTLGYRSSEIDNNKGQVLLIGDSVAWGYGVDDFSTPARNIEAQLASVNLQVNNLAVSGYDIGQYYLRLEQGLSVIPSPDWVVVVLYPGNDLRDGGSNVAYGKRKPLFVLNENEDAILAAPSISHYCLQNLFSMSTVLSVIQANRDPEPGPFSFLRKLTPTMKPVLDNVAGNMRIKRKSSKKVILSLLSKISDLATSHHSKLLYVLTPASREYRERSRDYLWFQQVLSSLPNAQLDFYEYVLANRIFNNNLYYDRSHYSKSGARIFAKAIADKILMQKAT